MPSAPRSRVTRAVRRGLFAALILLAVAAAPAAAAPATLHGWAFAGRAMPVQGATITFTAADGTPIEGLSSSTGLRGEFVVAVGDTVLPRQVVAVVRGGFIRDAPLRGTLRARVPLRGPNAGLIHVSPLSTLSVALGQRHPDWSTRRADRRAALLIGHPRLRHHRTHPHASGSALTRTSNRHVHAPTLHRHASRLGGYDAWIRRMLRNDRLDTVVRYRAPKRSSRATDPASRGGAATGAAIAWSIVSNAAESCDPSDSSVPGVGMIAGAIADAGVLSANPACDLAAINARLAAIQAQLDAMEQQLNAQSQLLATIQQTLDEDAYANAVNSLSTSTAAIVTVQLNTQVLVDTLASYQAPRSATNPSGLGMSLPDIFASTDPAVMAVAASLRLIAQQASGTSISGWDTAYARFTEPGVLVPGNSSRGLIRLGWSAVRAQGPFVTPDQLRNFTTIVNYHRSLYAALATQQIDVWRRQGVPTTVIVQNVALRKPLEDQLAGWVPRIPTIVGASDGALVVGPIIDPATGIAWATVCRAPSAASASACPADGAIGINAASPSPGNKYDPLSYWLPASLPRLSFADASSSQQTAFTWPTAAQFATLPQRAAAAGVSGTDAQARWLQGASPVLAGTASRPVFAETTLRVWDAAFNYTDIPLRTIWGCTSSTYYSFNAGQYVYGCSNGRIPNVFWGPNPSPTDGRAMGSAQMLVSGAPLWVGPTDRGGGNALLRVPCAAGAAACRPGTWQTSVEAGTTVSWLFYRVTVPTGVPLVAAKLANPSLYLPFPG